MKKVLIGGLILAVGVGLILSLGGLTYAQPTYLTTTPPYDDIESSHQGVAYSGIYTGGLGWVAAICDRNKVHYTECTWKCNKHKELTKEHGYKSAGSIAVRSGKIKAEGNEVIASAKVRIGKIVKWGNKSRIRILIQIFDLNTGRGQGTPIIVEKSGDYTPSVRMKATPGHIYQARIMVCAEVGVAESYPPGSIQAEIAAAELITIQSITIRGEKLI